MLSNPSFWRPGSWLIPSLLSPAAFLVAKSTAARVARPGYQAGVPVLCCGNAGVGGAGKTTLALDIAARLQRAGRCVHILTRGYGGRAKGPLRVDPAQHDARLVGDEALLLAACAPTWVCGDRAASARLAVALGAEVLLMDDGLQNPGLVKSFSFLTLDGGFGVGNGWVLPAGPLREPLAAAAARCGACVLIGADETGVLSRLPAGLAVLRASLVPGPELFDLRGAKVFAFAGIGRPEKFFMMLERGGVRVTRQAFADHHIFMPREILRLRQLAAGMGAVLVTTPKDFVRLPAGERAGILPIGVSLAWEDEPALDGLLAGLAA